MFFANYILKDRVTKIKNQSRNIKPEKELLKSEKSNLYAAIYDMKLAIEELYVATESNVYRSYSTLLMNKIVRISEAEDSIALIGIIEETLNIFENIDFEDSFSGNYEYRTYNREKYIDNDFIRNVVSHISTDRNFNIFDTECRRGQSLKAIKDTNDKAICYGLESDNSYAESAKEHATKIIKGQIKGSRIKNEVFDLLIANCSISATLKDNMFSGTVIKTERQFIQNIIKYIAPEGIVVIGIPFYRLHKDMCILIAKHFDKVTIVQGIGEKNNILHMAYIVGQKSKDKSINEEVYNMLRRCYDYKNIPSIFDVLLDQYKIGPRYAEVDLFKGSMLDVEELYNIVETSGCVDSFLQKQRVSKISENTKRPLLPFNVGQIGLVLTSGCLDGVIDEGNGSYHLIKGMVSKKSEVTKHVVDGILEESEVLSNKVEINVILPNGEFKTLA